MSSSKSIDIFTQAAWDGNEETVLSLLNRNEVNVNDKNKDGSTALIEAARYNHERIVSLLIDRGADINCKNNYGDTALMRAERGNYQNIISIIQNKLKIKERVNFYFVNS